VRTFIAPAEEGSFSGAGRNQIREGLIEVVTPAQAGV